MILTSYFDSALAIQILNFDIKFVLHKISVNIVLNC